MDFILMLIIPIKIAVYENDHGYEPQDKFCTFIPPQSSGIPASRQAGYTLRLGGITFGEIASLSSSTNKFFFTTPPDWP